MSVGIVFVFLMAMFVMFAIMRFNRHLSQRRTFPTIMGLLLLGGGLLFLLHQVRNNGIPQDSFKDFFAQLSDLQQSTSTSENPLDARPEFAHLEMNSTDSTDSHLKPIVPISIHEITFDQSHGPATRKPLEAIPDWTRAKSEFVPREFTPWVVVSHRYATPDEAREELSKRIGVELEKNQLYVKSNAERSGKHVEVYVRLSRENAILRECEVAWPLEVGGFQEKVYQVAWEIRINPEVVNRFHSDWKLRRSEGALMRLSFGFGAITLLFATVTFLQRKQRIN